MPGDLLTGYLCFTLISEVQLSNTVHNKEALIKGRNLMKEKLLMVALVIIEEDLKSTSIHALFLKI